jgi:imidazolonepropionase-like amidohydrolase
MVRVTAIRLIGLFLLASLSVAATAGTAIRAGHLIDPATGKVHHNQIILVKDQSIVAVGEDVDIPPNSQVIDLSDSWVMPGLMDAHMHITTGLPVGSDYSDGGAKPISTRHLMESTALRALRGVNNARILLEAGFTTVKDIGNSGNYATVDIRRAIAKGWFPGPTILDAGKIIAPRFGSQVYDFSPEQEPIWQYEYLFADTADEMRKAIRRNVYYGANTIKLVSERPAYTEAEIRVAVEEAARAGLRVSVHVSGENATAVILGGAHSVEHGGDLTDKQLKLMKKHGTYLSGTEWPGEHVMAMGIDKSITDEMTAMLIDRLRRAHKIGVKMAFSTDDVIDFPNKNRAQASFDFLKNWVAAGIPESDILKSMTVHTAGLFGMENERGVIKAGFKADIIATPKNPLDNIDALRGVNFVMKDGVIIRSSPTPNSVSRQ